MFLLFADLFKPVVTPKEYYKALYEFEPRNPDELQLDEGDIVVVRYSFIMYIHDNLVILITKLCSLMVSPTEEKALTTHFKKVPENFICSQYIVHVDDCLSGQLLVTKLLIKTDYFLSL